MTTTSLARERERFVARIVWEYATLPEPELNCTQVFQHAENILRWARRYGRLQEHYCNYGKLSKYNATVEQTAVKQIQLACEALGISAKFGGDPRGATVKLQLPSGYTNDWGAEGFCVPTS